jgi:hypothetical protein
MNNLKKIILTFLLLFSTSKAQMEISGFFDAIGVANFTNTENSRFLINQFELDFSYLHKTHFSVGSALAYNNETENMELAMAFIHYSFDEGPAKHPRRVETYDHSALLVGKFDVPFGLDYLSYASIDRPTLTQPLVMEKTIAGWNDVGVDFHHFAGNLKFDIWALNGFKAGVGLGGNIRYRFFPFLEIGVSHSADMDNFFKDVNDWLSGVDIRIDTETFEIKSEFLWMKGVYEGVPDTVLSDNMHHGGYFQVLTHLDKFIEIPLFVVLRIGGWQCSEDIEDLNEAQKRYTATVGYALHENLSVKFELVVNDYDVAPTETSGMLQIVVGF